MKLRHFIFLAATALVFTACNSNPAWDGPKPNGKVDKLAAETCSCVYDMMGAESGWDLPAILEEIKSIRKKTTGDLQAAVMASENPAITKAMQGEEDFSIKLDDCECMKPVQDGLLEQGVAFEEMMAKLDMHCLLGAFYN
jgi:hypothetical protein